jgi:hypothetical protein
MLDGIAGRRSTIGQPTADCDDLFDVGEREQSSFPIPWDFGVFAGFKAPAEGVGADVEKKAQIPGTVMVFVRQAKLVQIGRQVASIWF